MLSESKNGSAESSAETHQSQSTQNNNDSDVKALESKVDLCMSRLHRLKSYVEFEISSITKDINEIVVSIGNLKKHTCSRIAGSIVDIDSNKEESKEVNDAKEKDEENEIEIVVERIGKAVDDLTNNNIAEPKNSKGEELEKNNKEKCNEDVSDESFVDNDDDDDDDDDEYLTTKGCEWLLTEIPTKAYFPQKGDHVVFCKNIYQEYLKIVKKKNLYHIDTSKDKPWLKLDIKTEQFAQIANLDFDPVYPGLCNLHLKYFRSGNEESFIIRYHKSAISINTDFILLRQIYDEFVKRLWKVGDPLRVALKGRWHFGEIVRVDFFPEKKLYIKLYPDGKITATKHWKVETVDKTRLPKIRGRTIPILPEDIKILVYKPFPHEWPKGGQHVTCDDLLKVLNDKPLDYRLLNVRYDTFYSANVAYPIDIELIKIRLENRFYRRLDAVLFDVDCLKENIINIIQKSVEQPDYIKEEYNEILLYIKNFLNNDFIKKLNQGSKGRDALSDDLNIQYDDCVIIENKKDKKTKHIDDLFAAPPLKKSKRIERDDKVTESPKVQKKKRLVVKTSCSMLSDSNIDDSEDDFNNLQRSKRRPTINRIESDDDKSNNKCVSNSDTNISTSDDESSSTESTSSSDTDISMPYKKNINESHDVNMKRIDKNSNNKCISNSDTNISTSDDESSSTESTSSSGSDTSMPCKKNINESHDVNMKSMNKNSNNKCISNSYTHISTSDDESSSTESSSSSDSDTSMPCKKNINESCDVNMKSIDKNSNNKCISNSDTHINTLDDESSCITSTSNSDTEISMTFEEYITMPHDKNKSNVNVNSAVTSELQENKTINTHQEFGGNKIYQAQKEIKETKINYTNEEWHKNKTDQAQMVCQVPERDLRANKYEEKKDHTHEDSQENRIRRDNTLKVPRESGINVLKELQGNSCNSVSTLSPVERILPVFTPVQYLTSISVGDRNVNIIGEVVTYDGTYLNNNNRIELLIMTILCRNHYVVKVKAWNNYAKILWKTIKKKQILSFTNLETVNYEGSVNDCLPYNLLVKFGTFIQRWEETGEWITVKDVKNYVPYYGKQNQQSRFVK